MGRMTLMGIREHTDTLDQALSWHLAANLYPPVPQEFLEPCKRAIQLSLMGKPDSRVKLPKGSTYRGRGEAPAWAFVDDFRLDGFLDPTGEDE